MTIVRSMYPTDTRVQIPFELSQHRVPVDSGFSIKAGGCTQSGPMLGLGRQLLDGIGQCCSILGWHRHAEL